MRTPDSLSSLVRCCGSIALTATKDRLWIHSPKKGKGQTVHQMREAKGTITLISRNHQRIQTKTTMMFLLPTGLPKTPASRNRRNKRRVGKMTAN